MKYYLIVFFFFFAMLTYGQGKKYPPPKPIPLIFSHLLNSKISWNGVVVYFGESNNYILKGEYEVYETKKKITTDIVGGFYETGFIFQGKFNRGYKHGFWKTMYKNKLVKTANYNNGLAVGRYRVYNVRGDLLYKTTFGSKGNGNYKDYYYKTGSLKEEGAYKNGKKEGEWRSYNEQGALSGIKYYSNGQIEGE